MFLFYKKVRILLLVDDTFIKEDLSDHNNKIILLKSRIARLNGMYVMCITLNLCM